LVFFNYTKLILTMASEILEVFFEGTLQNVKIEQLIEFQVHIGKKILDPNVTLLYNL